MAQASRSKWFKDCGWALLVVLLLGLSAVLGRPGTAAAQQQALVSNLSQNDFATPSPIASAVGIVDHAQQFTTGSNAGGYKLNSVDIEFSQFDTGLSFSVSVYNSSEGKPGTLVGNLSTPTFSSFTSDTVLTFSASGDGIALAASTAYFVVLDVSGDRGSRIAGWRITTSMSEDSGAAAGWSIADKHLYRGNTDNADWRDNLIRSSLKIRVNGSLVTLPTVTVASVASPVTEGDPARFTVSRTGATTAALSVQLTVAEDNDDGQDFVAATGEGAKNFTIPSGSASSVFSVTTAADTIDEPAGEVTVTVTDSDDYTVGGASSAVVVVNDDDAAPMAVTLSADADTGTGGVQTTVTENGGAKTVRVTATVDGTTRFGASKTIEVQVGGSDDTAVEGTDYSTVANQMITIAPGANSGFVDFALTPANDSLAEPSQSLSIEGTLAGVTVAGTSVAITDDETAPPIVLSVAPTTAGESDGPVTVTVTATVDHATVRFDPARVVTVSVEDSDTDGVVGFAAVADFDVTIGSGEASGTETFTLTPTANSIDEEDETITVSGASTGPPAAASVTSATLTLTDDDDAGVTVSATARTVAENSGSATYTVVLTSQPTHDVTVTVASDDDSVVLVDGDDAGTVGSASETLTFTASGAKAWNVAQTVTVSGVNDDFANTDGERSATVTHTVASTDQKYDDFSPVGSVDVTVTDDDETPEIDLSVNRVSIAENAPAADTQVTVTATVQGTARFDTAKTVRVTVAGPEGDEFVDFTPPAAFDVTIAAGAATGAGSFVLAPVDDQVKETDATVTVGGASAGVTVNPASLMLTDDEADPIVALSAPLNSSITEGAQAEFALVATVASSKPLTLNVTVAETGGGDHVAADAEGSQTVTLPAYQTRVAYAVSTTDDSVAEPGTTIGLTLRSGTGYRVAVSNSRSVTVADDDTPTATDVTLTASSASVAEGGNLTVTVTLASVAPGDVVIPITAVNGSAVAGDYTAPAGVTVSAGESVGTATFSAADDAIDEPSETLTLRLGALPSGYAAGAPASVSVTIIDGDATTVTLAREAGATLTEGESIVHTLTLGRALAAGESLSVPLTFNIGTGAATRGADYTLACPDPLPTGVACNNLNSGDATVVFTGGAAAARTVAITLTATADSTAEPGGETVDVGVGSLAASTLDGGATASDDAAAFTVEDAPAVTDTAVTVGVNNGSVTEGGTLTVTATLAAAAASAVTIPITAVNGSAVAGDYTAPAGVTVSAGESVGTATFSAADDAIDEPSETLTLRLGALPSGYAAGAPASVSVTIIDGDATTVTLAREAGATLTEGESIVHTLTLGRALAAGESLSVPLTFNIGTGAATRGADYTLACPDPLPTGVACNNLNSGDATVVFTGGAAAARTVAITLTATADSTAEPGGETVDVGVGSLAASTLDGGATASDDAAAFTVEDAPAVTDTAVTVGVNNGSVTEGGTLTVTVTLASVAPGDVVIPITAVNGTAGSEDYSLSAAGVAITGGQSSGTVTLTAVDDTDEEGAETLSIRLGTLPDGYAAGTPSSVSVTINDPASTIAPAVTVIQTGGGTVVAENSGTDTYTITLAAEPSTNVSVAVISSTPTAARVDGPDPAIAPTASETLTFTPDDYDRPQTITVTGVDDSIDNPGNRRTVVITHSITAASAAEYRSIVISSVIVTVTDDDSPPPVTTITPPPAQAPEPPPALDPEPESEPDPEPAPVFEDFDDTTDTHRGSVAELTGDGTLDGIGCDDDRLCPKQPIMTWEFAVVLLRRIDNQQAPENAQTPDDQAEPGEHTETPDDQAELGDAEGSEGGEPDGDSETADPGDGSGASDENGGTPDSETLDDWWAPYLERLVELGVVTDCDDNADTAADDNCVGDVLTRAQAARLIAIVYNLPDATPAGFEDTADSPHAAAIDALHAAGITIGCTSDPLNYCPDQPISRQEAASMITRATRHLNSKA